MKESAMEKVKQKADSLGPEQINPLDGVRLDFEDSWMLIRASGTEPVIRVMTESTNPARAEQLADVGIRLVEEAIG